MRAWLSMALLITGCGIADFDVEQHIPEQVIEGSAVAGFIGAFFDFPITLEIKSEIDARETGPIDSVTLKSLVLKVTPTKVGPSDSDDWSFLDSVDIFIKSKLEGSQLPEKKIATAQKPGAVQSFPLAPVDGVNLIPYLNEGSEMTAVAKGNAPSDDVSFDGKAVFQVNPF
ncbi:MAG: hypothetical protein HY698_21200 [Deltaproteobacteria bacterium]|nr:hypothetical protein [Deltaproteobacteria bacterium]